MADTTETAIYKLRVEGQAEIERLTKSVNDLAKAEDTATAAARTASQGLQNQIARMDPLVKANQQYQKALETNLKYREAGKGTEAQLAAQMELAKAQLDKVVQAHGAYQAGLVKTTQATTAHVNASKLQRYEMINLSRQLQDVGVSLFSGQSPLTVIVQQGSQIADIAASSGVSMTNMFKQAAAGAVSFLQPVRLVAAGIVGIGAAAVYSAHQFASSQVEMQRALIGAGRRSASPGDINSIADSHSSPTGLSISETREAALEFAKAGQIHSRVIGDMIDTTKNFALVTGTSSKEAAAALAKAFTDMPGIDALNKQFNFLDATTRRSIETLLLAGKTTEAAALANQRLAGTLKDVESTQGVVAKGWTAIGNAISDVNSKVGEYIARAAGLAPKTKGDRATEIEGQVAGIKGQIEGGAFNNIFGDTTNLDKAAARLAQLREQLANIRAEQAKIAEQDTFRKLSVDAQQAVDATRPLEAQLRAVEGALTRLREASAAGINLPGMEQAVQSYTEIGKQLERQQASADALAKKYPGMTAEFAKQIDALKDQNKLIKAQQDGTEATTAAAIAYKNAMEGGSGETAAAAIRAETLKGYMLQAADATATWRQEMIGVGSAVEVVGANLSRVLSAQNAIDQSTEQYNNQMAAAQKGSAFTPTTMSSGQLSFGGGYAQVYARAQSSGSRGIINGGQTKEALLAQLVASSQPGTSGDLANKSLGRGGSIDSVIAELQTRRTSDSPLSTLQSLYGLKNSGADSASQIANDQQFLSWLQGQPQTIENLQAISSLTDEIQNLSKSTDTLNGTMQDALSPYYSQDPRMSHIGFRSQGMASTGYIDIPGVPSANDNHTLTIPVASGERVSVGNGPNRGKGGQTVSITNNITIAGNASKDEVGRTGYHLAQTIAKQVASAR